MCIALCGAGVAVWMYGKPYPPPPPLLSLQANMRMLMGEYKLESTEKAAIVLGLMNTVEVDDTLDYPLSYYIDAAKDNSTLEDAERVLIKECPICVLSYPIHEVRHLCSSSCAAVNIIHYPSFPDDHYAGLH